MTGARPPEVSVVVAVRDGGAELRPSLESVLEQRDVDLELIVVDDGSRDRTPEILREMAQGDVRIRPLSLAPSGITHALRAGCAQARAPLIARQDVGDRSLPGRFRAQADAFTGRPRLALVSCFTECVAPFGELLYTERGGGSPGVELELAAPDGEVERRLGPTSHGSTCFRRDLYEACGGYRTEFALGQDWDLWFRLGELGTFLTLTTLLYRRRLTPGSLSFRHRDVQLRFGALGEEAARRRRGGGSERGVLEEAAAFAAENALRSPASPRRAEALAWYHFGELLRRRGERAARRYFQAALRTDPRLARAWVRLAQSLLAPGSPGVDTRE